jgi:hypothetical protein
MEETDSQAFHSWWSQVSGWTCLVSQISVKTLSTQISAVDRLIMTWFVNLHRISSDCYFSYCFKPNYYNKSLSHKAHGDSASHTEIYHEYLSLCPLCLTPNSPEDPSILVVALSILIWEGSELILLFFFLEAGYREKGKECVFSVTQISGSFEFVFKFWDMLLLCSPGWLQTPNSASDLWVLGI